MAPSGAETRSAPIAFPPISSSSGCPSSIAANSIRKKPKQASSPNTRAALQLLSARSGN